MTPADGGHPGRGDRGGPDSETSDRAGRGDRGTHGGPGGPDDTDPPSATPTPRAALVAGRVGRRVGRAATAPRTALLVTGLAALLWAAPSLWGAPAVLYVEGGSMAPAMTGGDLVVVAPAAPSAVETGGATPGPGEGEVVVFQPPDDGAPYTVHRAALYVEAGEDWHDRAREEYLVGSEGDCEWHVDTCPAPRSGLITKGDANDFYDQAVDPPPGAEDAAEYGPVGRDRLVGVVVAHVPVPVVVARNRLALAALYLLAVGGRRAAARRRR